MKDIWLTDTQQRKEQFLNDQAKSSMLSTVVVYVLCHFTSFTVDFGNQWSSITIRMGMYVIFLVVQLMGLAMISKDLASLKDVYSLLQPSQSSK